MQTLNVVWHEGMLLRPQHFQGQDRYHEQQLALRIKGLLADARPRRRQASTRAQ